MGQRDAIQRVRDAIISVLEEHGAAYSDETNRKNHRASIRFDVNGRTGIIPYRAGDSRAALNAKMNARRALERIGIEVRKRKDGDDIDAAEPTQPEYEQPIETTGDATMARQPSTRDVSNGPAISDDQNEEYPPLHTPEGYVVYSGSDFEGGPAFKCIAVKLKSDLMAAAGEVVVWPLGARDVLWSMSEEKYMACFKPAKSLQEAREPASLSDDTVARLQAEIASLRSRMEGLEGALEALATVQAPSPMAPAETAPDTVAEPASMTPASGPYLPPAEIEPDVPQPVDPIPSSMKPPPPMGRLLVALYFLRGNNQFEVRVSDIGKLLTPNEAKQASTTLTAALSKGLVSRRVLHGSYRYTLTESGVEVAETIGTAPWDDWDLERPEWLQTLVEQIQEEASA